MSGVLIRREETPRRTQRGEPHVKTDTERMPQVMTEAEMGRCSCQLRDARGSQHHQKPRRGSADTDSDVSPPEL